MPSTTLTVTVYNGIPPLSIQVRLYKNGQLAKEFSKPNSFSYIFENLEGKYCLNIAGANPAGEGYTTIELTTDQITLDPLDENPVTKRKTQYSADFNFTAP